LLRRRRQVKIEQHDVKARVMKKSRLKVKEEIEATKRVKMDAEIEKERCRIAKFDESWEEWCLWDIAGIKIEEVNKGISAHKIAEKTGKHIDERS
jgi:hypothetical protein